MTASWSLCTMPSATENSSLKVWKGRSNGSTPALAVGQPVITRIESFCSAGSIAVCSRILFCVTLEILKLSKVMLLNPLKISDLRKDFLWKRGAPDRVSAMTYCAPFLFFTTNYHRRSLMRMACSRCGALLRGDFLKILSSGWWFIWNLTSDFP